ncbi:response regulator transcription factor [Maritimibacter fusiformis]|uniref:Response regulator transcription factor n=1 Tax=Maritimibacter fusiformis TaxID=2603819 RepID=A0A5D0RHJ6_9RHOB|nr:response regulator transcription factor [Maritimibacter fusiformis]TYB81090.1 response regulator transcription factor [Maritimibacter fusiformis]
MRVLLVEDALDLADATRSRLRKSGVACDHAMTLAEARDFLAVQGYDVVILDISLPDGSGTDLLREMRQAGHTMPVLMLTAQFSVENKLSAFSFGADDYLVKPFDQRELEARLHVLHRRKDSDRAGEIRIGALSFDPLAGVASVDGARLDLTRREFALLGILMRHKGQVHSKDHLLEGLYSFDDAVVGANAIELYVARLRKKIAGSGVSIRTLRGRGYVLDADG